MVQDYCELRFASDPAQVRYIVRCLLEFLGGVKNELSPDDRDDLKLVLSELLFNAVIHGNKENRSKYVHVRIESIELEPAEPYITVCIKDEGPGFDHVGALKRALSEDVLLSEDGRGMMLVNALTDSLTFNEAGNQLWFTKKVTHG